MLRLRWAFYWKDGGYLYGMWDLKSPHLKEQAFSQSLQNLDRVEIHAEESGITSVRCVCSAENFLMFQWIGDVCIPLAFGGQQYKTEVVVRGIKLITKNHSTYSLMKDGNIKRVIKDGNYNYNNF